MQKGLIILDGPDGTGKTTLARHLVNNYGAHYLHLTYRWKDKMHLYHTAALLHCLKKAEGQLVVLDRWWISELLYAYTYRGGSRWPQLPRLLDRLAIRHGALTVICLPESLEAHKQHFERLRGERFEMYDSISDVTRRYIDLYEGTGKAQDYAGDLSRLGGVKFRPDFMRYRFTLEGQALARFSTSLIERLKVLSKKIPEWQAHLETKNLLGNPGEECRYIIVGDRPNVKNRRTSYPFFSLSGCSAFFLEAMAKINIPERQLAWVNINDDLGATVLINVVSRSPMARLIVLGDEARRRLDRLSFSLLSKAEARVVKHPQWYNRFHHNDGLFEADLRRAFYE